MGRAAGCQPRRTKFRCECLWPLVRKVEPSIHAYFFERASHDRTQLSTGSLFFFLRRGPHTEDTHRLIDTKSSEVYISETDLLRSRIHRVFLYRVSGYSSGGELGF